MAKGREGGMLQWAMGQTHLDSRQIRLCRYWGVLLFVFLFVLVLVVVIEEDFRL